MEQVPNDGLVHFRDFFNADALVPTSHENLKTILSDNTYDYEKVPAVARVLRSIIGDGLILVEGAVHKFQRQRECRPTCPHRYLPLTTHQTCCRLFKSR